jgi:hypothetical protein
LPDSGNIAVPRRTLLSNVVIKPKIASATKAAIPDRATGAYHVEKFVVKGRVLTAVA